MHQFDKTEGRKYENNKPKNGVDKYSLRLVSYEEWTHIRAYVKSVCQSKSAILLSIIRGSVHCCKKCAVILNLCSMSYVEDHVSWNITIWTYPLVALCLMLLVTKVCVMKQIVTFDIKSYFH